MQTFAPCKANTKLGSPIQREDVNIYQIRETNSSQILVKISTPYKTGDKINGQDVFDFRVSYRDATEEEMLIIRPRKPIPINYFKKGKEIMKTEKQILKECAEQRKFYKKNIFPEPVGPLRALHTLLK
jgi:hypothetical protein